MNRLSWVAAGSCVAVGIVVLAGIFHDPTVEEPRGWIVAFGLAAGILGAAPMAFALLVYLPRLAFGGPPRSFRELGDGSICISAFAYPSMWAGMRSLAPDRSSVDGTGHFSLVVDARGLDFRVGGRDGAEIAFAGWPRVRSVSTAVIAHGSRSSRGLSITFFDDDDEERTVDFTCAREGVIGVFGRQRQDELDELRGRIRAHDATSDAPTNSGVGD